MAVIGQTAGFANGNELMADDVPNGKVLFSEVTGNGYTRVVVGRRGKPARKSYTPGEIELIYRGAVELGIIQPVTVTKTQPKPRAPKAPANGAAK